MKPGCCVGSKTFASSSMILKVDDATAKPSGQDAEDIGHRVKDY